MKHSLVTGGAGFIGSHLAEALLARGDRVWVIDDESTGSIENLAAASPAAGGTASPAAGGTASPAAGGTASPAAGGTVLEHPNFSYVKGTVADRDLVRRLVAEADEVYHLAAAVGVRLIAQSPIHTIEANIAPTELLLDELGRIQGRGRAVKLFLASSSEVYGKNPKPQWAEDDDMVIGPTTCPRWSYGASKAIDEFLALAYWRQRKLPVVVGRLFNVVGPRQKGDYGMVLPRLVEAALDGGPLVVHDDGRQQRCFAHVSDVLRAIVGLMGLPGAVGRVFNIGSDQPISILELAGRVIAAVDPSLSIEFVSYAEAYSKDFEDCRRRVPDLSRLREAIGFEPRHGLDQCIREVVAWKLRQKG